MGLTRKQAESRFERAMSFAGLEGFESMKLRNYSSGMKVRLAFAIMVEIDGDVMMIDEVLAVGDTAFQRKSARDLQELQGSREDRDPRQPSDDGDSGALRSGASIGGWAYRAGRRSGGLRAAIFGARGRGQAVPRGALHRRHLLSGGNRGPLDRRPAGGHFPDRRALGIDPPPCGDRDQGGDRECLLPPRDPKPEPGADLLASGHRPNGGERLPAGERMHVEATIENRLTPDVYFLSCAVNRRDEGDNDRAVSDAKSIEFAIPGDRYRGQGLLRLEHTVTMEGTGQPGSTAPEDGHEAHDAASPRPRRSRCSEVRGPSAFGGETKRFLQLLVADLEDRAQDQVSGRSVRHGLVGRRAAAHLRRHVRGVLVRRAVRRRRAVLPRDAADEHHALQGALRGKHGARNARAWSRARTSSARPSSRGSSFHCRSCARRGCSSLPMCIVLMFFLLINGAPPMATWLLFPVIVLGVPDSHGGDVAAPVEPLRPLSRHGADLERHLTDLLLRLAGDLSRWTLSSSSLRGALFIMNPFVPDARAGADLDDRPDRAPDHPGRFRSRSMASCSRRSYTSGSASSEPGTSSSERHGWPKRSSPGRGSKPWAQRLGLERPPKRASIHQADAWVTARCITRPTVSRRSLRRHRPAGPSAIARSTPPGSPRCDAPIPPACRA